MIDTSTWLNCDSDCDSDKQYLNRRKSILANTWKIFHHIQRLIYMRLSKNLRVISHLSRNLDLNLRSKAFALSRPATRLFVSTGWGWTSTTLRKCWIRWVKKDMKRGYPIIRGHSSYCITYHIVWPPKQRKIDPKYDLCGRKCLMRLTLQAPKVAQ